MSHAHNSCCSQTIICNIAGLCVELRFKSSASADARLLTSLEPFISDTDSCQDQLFSLTVDNTMKRDTSAQLLRSFDTGNGETTVSRLPDGGYQYIVCNPRGDACCLLECHDRFTRCHCALRGDEPMRLFGLNNALMMAFAFAGSYRQTLLIHASCVRKGQWAYPFTAKSGTGKSTHTGLWMQCIEGCDLLNDDNPVVRIVDNRPFVYGSPWSGKTPCYRNISARLGAVTQIERSLQNRCDRLSPVEAFATLLPACSSMLWDADIHANVCNTITRIIESTPCYTMHCRPDEDAAQVCHKTICRA